MNFFAVWPSFYADSLVIWVDGLELLEALWPYEGKDTGNGDFQGPKQPKPPAVEW